MRPFILRNRAASIEPLHRLSRVSSTPFIPANPYFATRLSPFLIDDLQKRHGSTLTLFGQRTSPRQTLMDNAAHDLYHAGKKFIEVESLNISQKQYDTVILAAHGKIRGGRYFLNLFESYLNDDSQIIPKLFKLQEKARNAKRIFVFSCNAGGLINDLKKEPTANLHLFPETQIITFGDSGQALRAGHIMSMIEEVIDPKNENLTLTQIRYKLTLQFATTNQVATLKQKNGEEFLEYDRIDLHLYPDLWQRIINPKKKFALEDSESKRLAELKSKEVTAEENLELHKLTMLQDLFSSYGSREELPTSFPSIAFMEAILRKDNTLVRQWHETGLVDVNYKDYANCTPALQAAMAGNLEDLKFLYSQGASVEANDQNGRDLFYFAIVKNHRDVIEFLVDRDLVPSRDSNSELSLLAIADGNDDKTLVNFLIEKKVGINEQDVYGKTPLIYFCETQNENIVDELLKNNVDLNKVNIDGNTALMMLLRYRTENVELMNRIMNRLLDASADINIVNTFGQNALTFAVLSDNFEATKTLLSLGIQPVLFDKPQKTKLIDLTDDPKIKDLLTPIYKLQETIDAIPTLKDKIVVGAYKEKGSDTLKPKFFFKNPKGGDDLFATLSTALFRNDIIKNIGFISELLSEAAKDRENPNQFKSEKSFDEMIGLIESPQADICGAKTEKMKQSRSTTKTPIS